MPNGSHGPDEVWERLEGPLRQADSAIAAFGERHGGAVSGNYHNWPERSICWGSKPKRMIQIYLDDEAQVTWNVWICASEDRGQQRFWKRSFLRRGVPMSVLLGEIDSLLEEGLRVVSSWTSEQLEFATTLRE